MITIQVKSMKTGRVMSGKCTLREIFTRCNEEIIEEITMCDCQPVGESNVISCNCYEEWLDDIEIIIKSSDTGWELIGNWNEL